MMKVTRLPASAAKKMVSSSKKEIRKTESTPAPKPAPKPTPKPTSKPTEPVKSSSTIYTEDFFGSTVSFIPQIH